MLDPNTFLAWLVLIYAAMVAGLSIRNALVKKDSFLLVRVLAACAACVVVVLYVAVLFNIFPGGAVPPFWGRLAFLLVLGALSVYVFRES